MKITEKSIDKKVDERGVQILGNIYKRVFRVSDIIIALVAAVFFMISLYSEVTFTAKEVAILLVVIAFVYRLMLKYSIKRSNIIEEEKKEK